MVAGLAVASQAFADSLVLSTNSYSNASGGSPTLGGGSFTVTNSGLDNSGYALGLGILGADLTSFETFCLEWNEGFVSGSTFNFELNPYAKNGGVLAGGQDYISVGTAWLYSQFATGSLAAGGFDYSSGRQLSNTQLQLAFWWLEDEIGPTAGQLNPGLLPYIGIANPFLTYAASSLSTTIDDLKADATGEAFGVQVLNLYKPSNGAAKQSQLYYTTPAVPDSGSTLVLLTGAVFALLGLRRKK
jgi:hypothetical protein